MTKIASRKQYLIGGAVVVLAAVGLYGVVPQFGNFDDSLQALRHADRSFILAAAAASVFSVFCSAAIYTVLAVRRIRFADTLLVQLAGLLINRVLPAGIGGLGLSYLYLRAHKHTITQATSVVTLNNSIGFVGHLLLALGLLALLPSAFSDTALPDYWWPVAAGIVGVVAVGVLVLHRVRPKLFRAFRGVAHYYRARPQRLAGAVAISLGLTLANVLSLWLCCQALDVSLSFITVFIVFTFGIVVGTATPTPGGLGGVEAGLVGALVAQDVTAASALAIALLYRLASYWFGLFLGGVATVGVLRRQLLG